MKLTNLVFIILLCVSSNGYTQEIGPYVKYVFDSTTVAESSDHENVVRFYDWITQNIKLDVNDKYHYSPQHPKITLKTKRGNGYDLVRVLQQFCDDAGIENIWVYTYAKDGAFVTGKTFNAPNAACLAVSVNGKYFFVDPLMGAGYFTYHPAIIDKVAAAISRTMPLNSVKKYVHQPNPNFVMIPIDSLVKTQIPIDPAFQFTNKIYALSGFVHGENYWDSINYADVNYIDTLNGENYLSERNKQLKSAHRVNRYNPDNHFSLCMANKSLGEMYYDVGQSVKDTSAKVDKLKLASSYLKEAIRHSNIHEAKCKANNKKELDTQKAINRARLGYDKKQIKANQKAISNNQKAVSKSQSTINKLKNDGKKILMNNEDILKDDAIYYVQKPRPGDSKIDDKAAFKYLLQLKENDKKIASLINVQQNRFVNEIDSVIKELRFNKNQTIKLVQETIELEAESREWLALGDRQYDVQVEKQLKNIYSNWNKINELKVKGEKESLILIKGNFKSLQNTNKQIISLRKENKKLLMDILANTSESYDEEVRYDFENEEIMKENQYLVDVYNAYSKYLLEEKKIFMEEDKVRKKEIKSIIKSSEIEKKRYNYNKTNINQEYKARKQRFDAIQKELTTMLKKADKESETLLKK